MDNDFSFMMKTSVFLFISLFLPFSFFSSDCVLGSSWRILKVTSPSRRASHLEAERAECVSQRFESITLLSAVSPPFKNTHADRQAVVPSPPAKTNVSQLILTHTEL